MTNSALRPTRRNALGLIGATLVLPQIAQAAATRSIHGAAFGTTWQLVASHHDDLERLRADIDALFAMIDQQMSPWRSDSDISRFNTMGAGRHRADAEMILVATAALDLAKASLGAFDPTVGPLVAQWGFGPIEGGLEPDWRGLSLGESSIGKARDDLSLDLCGIAKGRALDLAVDLVKARGVDNFLFDVGGELKAVGQHPSGRSFKVAVQHPVAARSAPATLRLVDGMAVATSGLRMQSYELADNNYGHIIDPRTRVPANDHLLSVTVTGRDAMIADGWATALFAAGLTGGPDLAESNNIDALFLTRDGAGLSSIKTGAIEGALL
ncbi:FAD:protein FMN transferase [Litoreibacter halocynthiae]|uniref:FAD:protein FMN transferase n=1 Tax=Litoreibacter halocynthiae TaxID=1242689 RepID=UPI002491A99D|nr:FAD:protein FMN transferase [Litoreibacter halocynthiae]